MEKRRNYLAMIKNSQGTQAYRNFYKNGEDILKNGDLSCAYFVASILHIHRFISSPHVTVTGTLRDMHQHGWRAIVKPKIGCVIIWEPIKQNGSNHLHIGFYIGDGQAISNRSSLGMPGEHSLHYSGLDKEGKKRKAKVQSYLWHDDLGHDTIEQ